jgi:type I restriction enzyme, S subunit
MSRYRPYQAYKDSGVEWIGRVPEHWEAVPLGKIAVERCDGPFGSGLKSEHYTESGVRVVRLQNIGYAEFKGDDSAYIDASYWQKELGGGHDVQPGDVLIAGLGDENNPLGRACVAPDSIGDAIVKADCYRFRLGSRAIAGYVALALSATSKAECGFLATGATRDRLNLTLASARKVPLPPRSEQAAIVVGLDRETARIDALIAKKTRFIALLKEKRQALITHAVTKGLDPSVKMKDSGVEWIGEVPEHWDVSKLAYTTREAGGKTPDTKNSDYWDGDVPWVSPKDMKQPELVDAIDKITRTAVEDCRMSLFPPGTVVVVVRGMILVHSFPVAELKVPASINQDMKALTPDRRIRSAYLRLLLESAKEYVVAVLVAEAAHGTRVLRTDIWRQLPALLPPLAEQNRILEHLTRMAGSYDKLIESARRSIALLKERRASLITAAVTGQIDLRHQSGS